jgi:uncharacterized damage-inducible protein DinB
MAEDRDDLLRHYHQMREELLAVIEDLTDDQLSERTLDGWSVKDHLLHLSLWDEIRASEVSRISAGQESAWRMNGEQDGTFSALGHELRLDLSAQQAKWELASSRQRLMDAISLARKLGLEPSRYGEAGLRSTHEAQHTEWIKRWRQEKTW